MIFCLIFPFENFTLFYRAVHLFAFWCTTSHSKIIYHWIDFSICTTNDPTLLVCHQACNLLYFIHVFHFSVFCLIRYPDMNQAKINNNTKTIAYRIWAKTPQVNGMHRLLRFLQDVFLYIVMNMLNGEKKIRSELLVKLIFDKQRFLACMIYNKKWLLWTEHFFLLLRRSLYSCTFFVNVWYFHRNHKNVRIKGYYINMHTNFLKYLILIRTYWRTYVYIHVSVYCVLEANRILHILRIIFDERVCI